MAALRHGPLLLRVTVPEGYTARQTAALLAAVIPGFSARTYVDLTLTHPLAFSCPGFRSGAPLEGFLFPATYEVSPSISPRRFVELQLDAFRSAMARVGMAHAAAKDLTDYDVGEVLGGGMGHSHASHGRAEGVELQLDEAPRRDRRRHLVGGWEEEPFERRPAAKPGELKASG